MAAPGRHRQFSFRSSRTELRTRRAAPRWEGTPSTSRNTARGERGGERQIAADREVRVKGRVWLAGWRADGQRRLSQLALVRMGRGGALLSSGTPLDWCATASGETYDYHVGMARSLTPCWCRVCYREDSKEFIAHVKTEVSSPLLLSVCLRALPPTPRVHRRRVSSSFSTSGPPRRTFATMCSSGEMR